MTFGINTLQIFNCHKTNWQLTLQYRQINTTKKLRTILDLKYPVDFWGQPNLNKLDAGMWQYHANRIDARCSQFDLGRVDSKNHCCTNRHRSNKTVPTVYQRCTNRQKQSKNSQNSKNDHWCTNRHRSTMTVPTVYQSSKTVKNSQNTIKTAQKWPLVNCRQSPHVYQDCPNSVTIVYQSSTRT